MDFSLEGDERSENVWRLAAHQYTGVLQLTNTARWPYNVLYQVLSTNVPTSVPLATTVPSRLQHLFELPSLARLTNDSAN